MKRKALIITLITAAVLLSGCAGQSNQERFPVATQYIGPAATEAPTAPPEAGEGGQSVFDTNPYVDTGDAGFTEADALNEEGLGAYDDFDDGGMYDDPNAGAAYGAATAYPYAGATPIPLNPIDMPTPTPRPDLAFTFIPYEVAALGLKFEAPAGWVPDESIQETYILAEPESQMKEGQLGTLSIFAVPVAKQFTERDLKTEINERLSTISSTNFTEWEPSLTASRYLMGSVGIYANYTGTLSSGVKVGGRVHATCIDRTLYCVQITYPLGYRDDFMEVFSKVRETIKRIQ